MDTNKIDVSYEMQHHLLFIYSVLIEETDFKILIFFPNIWYSSTVRGALYIFIWNSLLIDARIKFIKSVIIHIFTI